MNKTLEDFQKFWLKPVAILSFAIFVGFWLVQIRTAPLLYDDSVMASVAKNLAQGHGYSTSYVKFKPFDHIITTGPTLILPVSALVRIFGNQYWVPALGSSLVVLTLVFAFLLLMRRMIRPLDHFWWFLLCFSLLGFWISDEVSHSGEYRYFKPWYSLVGETAGSFFFLLGFVCLIWDWQKPKQTGGRFFGFGLLLGLGLLTKFIFLVPLVTLVGGLFLWSLIERRSPRSLLLAAVVGIAGLLPIGIYAGLKTIFRDPELASFGSFLRGNASGINEMLAHPNKIAYAMDNFERGVHTIAGLCGGDLSIFIIVIIGLILIRNGLRTRRPIAVTGLAVLVAGFSILVWWLFFSPFAWVRHVIPALILIWIGSLLLQSEVLLRKQFILGGIVLLLVFGGRRDLYGKLIAGLSVDERVTMSLEAKRQLERLPLEQTQLLGCAWWANRDLEYLLDSSVNFQDCLTFLPNRDPHDQRQVVLVRNATFWNWENSAVQKRLQELCDQKLIWRGGEYTISKCENLQNFDSTSL